MKQHGDDIEKRGMVPLGKRPAFAIFDKLPVIRETNDPEYAGVLLLFVCGTLLALILVGWHGSGYTHVLQTAGGLLVVLGVYITGVSLRTARLEQYIGRLMTALAQLDSSSEAIQLGTIRLLETLLAEAPNVTGLDRLKAQNYKTAIVEALNALDDKSNRRVASLAREVSGKLTVKPNEKGE